ncbi:hypothetical protein [Desulfoplanes formicivorans]|uniref:Uncharacterized protein n=1 Tax=Desulfoplanes formicivorans TaxID=1592317 RepID=A0A194AKE2_9BACT|nr:hypothetical protein [Desulfoplanes formicivorans]GAU09705.1 hypothetical protein DPF_2436 [Desulfoplanes formicivorans]
MESPSETMSYAQSIAADIFAMISTSREQGLDLDAGFQNQAFSNQVMAIRYLFFPKKELLHMGLFPRDMKQRFKTSNILSIVEQNGKAISVNLLCTLHCSFADIESAKDIEAHLHAKELDKFADAVRSVLSKDLQEAAASATSTN